MTKLEIAPGARNKGGAVFQDDGRCRVYTEGPNLYVDVMLDAGPGDTDTVREDARAAVEPVVTGLFVLVHLRESGAPGRLWRTYVVEAVR